MQAYKPFGSFSYLKRREKADEAFLVADLLADLLPKRLDEGNEPATVAVLVKSES